MSGIRAFMKRDWFTCDQCMSLEFHGFQPYCAQNMREIRWQLKQYGCGHFAENDKEYEKRQWRMRHDCLTDTDKAEIHLVGRYGDEPYRKTVYHDPKDIIKEITGWDAKEGEE